MESLNSPNASKASTQAYRVIGGEARLPTVFMAGIITPPGRDRQHPISDMATAGAAR